MNENLYAENSIRTFSGKFFDLLKMDPDTIDIMDIAHGLSMNVRFGGQLKRFYSIAQHCVLAYELAPAELKLQALLHDASEAYMLDMPKPFKKLMPDYMRIENALMLVISEKFGFQYPLSPEVKEIDQRLLVDEWHGIVLDEKPFECWPQSLAAMKFMDAFYSIK